MSEIVPEDYTAVLGEIRQRIRSAQYEALRAVNRKLVSLYWDIGRLIVERQMGIHGESPWWKHWHAIFRRSFLACRDFPLAISGT